MKSTFSATLDKFDNTLYLYHVKVPDEIYTKYADQKIKRVIVTFNGSKEVHNAFLSVKDGPRYIKLSKDVMNERELKEGEHITVVIREDTSKYGMPISPETEELLAQDPEGKSLFHQLTPGKIRSLLFKVNGYKTSDKRIETSIIILEHLKANGGALDWKMLNEAFKIGYKL